MDYQETLQYLFVKTPAFQQVGQSAYKPGLDNVLELSKAYHNPYQSYPCIHVGGTNGKGSCSHTLAAILQSAGYKVGLYTSPHLRDFSERIRVNGQPIDHQYVVDFVAQSQSIIEKMNPSFFEITTMMAFQYFQDQKVDVAVIEVGLGGRLDSTNIISPVLSIVTNVSFDHMALLGNTLEKIAYEKAGILKPGIPAVVGEAPANLRPVYNARGTEIVYAEDHDYPNYEFELKGLCQQKNRKTILAAVEILQKHFTITVPAIQKGMANVVELTGLMGRWQKIQDTPRTIVDTGHNEGGIRLIAEQLRETPHNHLRIVLGVVSDKDIHTILSLLPKEGIYYFTNAAIPRALKADKLQAQAAEFGLTGKAYASVQQALDAAQHDALLADAAAEEASKAQGSGVTSLVKDLVFVGGSNFTVAEII